mmetsp:Transcript_60757/g.144776  ORF Transcript_60757/g.144776 Transcript_60757/m.144776 type:complete len:259 (+) Transcript_60757:939-1715(+)
MSLNTTWHLPGHLVQQLRGLRVAACLPVKLYCLDLLVFVKKMLRVLCQETFDLLEIVLLREVHRQLPLVQQDTRVNRRLDVTVPQIGLDGLLAEAHGAELVAHLRQQRAAFRQLRNESLQGVIILQEIVGVHQSSVVSRLGVVIGRVGPLATVRVVVADSAPCLVKQLLVGTVRQLNDSEPVTQAHTKVDREVLAVDFPVQALSLIEPLKVCRDLGLLLDPVVQKAEALDELDALVILEAHEGLFGHPELELLQSRLC